MRLYLELDRLSVQEYANNYPTKEELCQDRNGSHLAAGTSLHCAIDVSWFENLWDACRKIALQKE